MSSESADTAAVDAPLQSLRFVGPATAAVLEREGYDTTAITDKRVSFRMLVDADVNPGVAAKIRREHSLSWSFNSGGDLDRRSTQIRGLGSAEAAWIAASAGDWEDASDESTTDSKTQVDDAEAVDSETQAVDTESDNGEATENEPDDNPWSTNPTPWPTHGESVDAVTGERPGEAATDGSGDAISAEAAWRARSTLTPVGDLAGVDETAVNQLAEAGITSVRSLATANPEHIADVLGLSGEVVDGWYQVARETYETS